MCNSKNTQNTTTQTRSIPKYCKPQATRGHDTRSTRFSRIKANIIVPKLVGMFRIVYISSMSISGLMNRQNGQSLIRIYKSVASSYQKSKLKNTTFYNFSRANDRFREGGGDGVSTIPYFPWKEGCHYKYLYSQL